MTPVYDTATAGLRRRHLFHLFHFHRLIFSWDFEKLYIYPLFLFFN